MHAQIAYRYTDRTLYMTLIDLSQVLCPLQSVPIFVGIGLNYKHHAAEAGVRLPASAVLITLLLTRRI
jgi:hypothetical protein